jgi:hypothetical protein
LHPTATVLLILVALTSLGAYGLGVRVLRLSPGTLPCAMRRLLLGVGLALLFLAANAVLGMTAILATRATGRFITPYLINDVTLVILSLLQGLVFAHWLEASRERPPD